MKTGNCKLERVGGGLVETRTWPNCAANPFCLTNYLVGGGGFRGAS